MAMEPSKTLSVVGAAASLYLAIRLTRFIRLYTRPSSLHTYRHGQKPWALVTGASDGIGRGFVHELAQNGFNVVLHGRNPKKLADLRAKLTQAFPTIEFRIVVLDASTASSKEIDELVASIQDLHITILINNVGGGDTIRTLESNTGDSVDATINLNLRFPAQLTRAMLPTLTKKPRTRALIMNICSIADDGIPYVTMYSGGKAFNKAMSKSLAIELHAEQISNIEVLAIVAGKVTEVANTTDPVNLVTPGARTFAKAALQRVGCGRSVVMGYFWHAVAKFIIDLMPEAVRLAIVIPELQRQKDKWEKAL